MSILKHNILEQKILAYAKQSPDKVAIQGTISNEQNINEHLTYQDLLVEINRLYTVLGLSHDRPQSFAIIMNNHPAWAVLDLCLMFHQQCAIPIPAFFSVQQIKHALVDAKVDHLILEIQDSSLLNKELNKELSELLEELFEIAIEITIADKAYHWYQIKTKTTSGNKADDSKPYLSKSYKGIPKGIQKITYTSGTTAQPKGVMLTEQAIIEKVKTLVLASEASEDDIALSILPLSTLLENIAGIYVPLFCGAQITLLSPDKIGISGSSKIDIQQLMNTLSKYQPTVFVIIPQLLLLLIQLVQSSYSLPKSIRFIAMGGAPVSKKLLTMAQQLNIPVYEGYGFSEAASVVAMNTPKQNRLGSVGKILPSHQIKISAEGEILIKNNLFTTYMSHPGIQSNEFYASGDIGEIDEDGFIYITGRKTNVMNTAYGRNISPEWIEKELEAIPVISQSLIYGHAKPFLVALLVLRKQPGIGDNKMIEQLDASLEKLNSSLPDYARIADYSLIDSPFSVQNNQLTGTGRPRRKVIYDTYKNNLDCFYD